MSSDMYLRELYLPGGTALDLVAAHEVAQQLCRHATIDDLRVLLDADWLNDDSVPELDNRTDEAIAAHTETLRSITERLLRRLLDELAASLQRRDVARCSFHTDNGGSVDAYITGGVSPDGAPTDAYTAWDIVFDTDRFPDGWCDRIGAACGLLHPHGDGPTAATIVLHAWAAAAPAETGNP